MGQRSLKSDRLYGAFEMKRTYQGNMLKGLGLSCLVMLCALAAYEIAIAMRTAPEAPEETDPVPWDTTIRVVPMPPITIEPPVGGGGSAPIDPSRLGILIPKPDELVEFDVDFVTQDELETLYVSTDSTGTFGRGGEGFLPGDPILGSGDDGEVFTFVPHDTGPVVVHLEPPEYPQIARLGGWEGRVVLHVKVGADGRVEKVVVAVPSGSNAGFDEAAVEAAYENRYKPALWNGEPVAVWVSYPVEFRLR